MLNKPSLSEKIIMFLSEQGDLADYPKSFGQMLNWDREMYFRERGRMKAQEKRQRRRILRALKSLEEIELLSFNKTSKKFKLTSAGWLRYLYYYSKKQQSKSKHKFGGKYIIVFDIPESHRRFRDLFRQTLQNHGCRQIQKSVFMCPDQEIFNWAQKVVAKCHLDGHVKFIEAKKIY